MTDIARHRVAKIADHDQGWVPPEGEATWHLPGFVEGEVTYESHTFWVTFNQWQREPDLWRTKHRPDAVIIMRNGSGLYQISVRCMFARPLRDMFMLSQAVDRQEVPQKFVASRQMVEPVQYLRTDLERSAFMMCWGIFEQTREAAELARARERATLYQHFANGRLKKRKLNSRAGCNVWVEDAHGWKTGRAAVAYDGDTDA